MGDLTSWFHMTFHGFPHAWGESGDRPHTVWEDLTLTHFRRHLVVDLDQRDRLAAGLGTAEMERADIAPGFAEHGAKATD